MKLTAVLALALALTFPSSGQFAGAQALDDVIESAIRANQIPGAVLLAGHQGRIVYYKAYGNRALTPAREPMTQDTIFDAASLTKVVATSASIMKLFEQGKIRLADPVTAYLPAFQGGKSTITVRQLMTHFSGLRPDVDLKPAWSGYELGIQKALTDKPVAQPGERFIYSDINYVLLGEIVRVVSGKPLDEYARDNVFQPLGMAESGFRPPPALKPRIAPTELTDGVILRGVVHDPTARYMGGVAGHAGLFTTATDLSKFAQMMLKGGAPIVSAAAVKKFTEPQTPPHQYVLRGLGWDIDSPYSTARGELFPIGSYGHTGFTGTSLWIDPKSQTYVILLTNSVHPHRRPAITALRSKVATIVAANSGLDVQEVTLTGMAETNGGRAINGTFDVLTGLDVLAAQNFAPLQGKRTGLITNHTGLTREGKRNIDVMLQGGVRLTALFSPEHGIAGKEDQENVANSKDIITGLPVYSLFLGAQRKPNQQMLAGIDVLVFDIQDIGTRFYTYASTMKGAMEVAAQMNLPFMVLDRPNPINGAAVEGPMLDPDLISFVGCTRMPLRHGMTLGELAGLINTEDKINAQLQVVKLQNWRRTDWWDSTGLPWINPSPNMRSLNAALLYPGVGAAEYARNYSVGRGTDAPFEQIGADWIRGRELATYLNKRFVPGVRFYPARFLPEQSNFKGQTIEGVRFVITDRESFSSLRLGLEIAVAIEKLYPGKIAWDANAKLIGNHNAIAAIKRGDDPRAIELDLLPAVRDFMTVRQRYLLYP